MLLGLGSLCVFQFGSSLSFVGSTHHMLLALGSLCIFPCAPCFQLRAGRVLFIARGAHWGPAKYEGATRVTGSWVSVCFFSCAPCFQLRGGRVLFIARGAHWGPANYEGASRRISRSRQFLDLSRCSLDLSCSVLCISLPPPRGLLLSEVIFWSLQS